MSYRISGPRCLVCEKRPPSQSDVICEPCRLLRRMVDAHRVELTPDVLDVLAGRAAESIDAEWARFDGLG